MWPHHPVFFQPVGLDEAMMDGYAARGSTTPAKHYVYIMQHCGTHRDRGGGSLDATTTSSRDSGDRYDRTLFCLPCDQLSILANVVIGFLLCNGTLERAMNGPFTREKRSTETPSEGGAAMATRASSLSDDSGGSLAPKGMDKVCVLAHRRPLPTRAPSIPTARALRRPQVTYKQTKDYLISLGLNRKELTGARAPSAPAAPCQPNASDPSASPHTTAIPCPAAPSRFLVHAFTLANASAAATKFQLKEIAESKGVDLGPLFEKRKEVRRAPRSADHA